MAIPVILDTDIGGDIDDAWALALLLRSPELDLKLVVADTGDTTYRAAVAARMLEIAGRADVPVGVGIPLEETPKLQAPLIAGYRLDAYPGDVHPDGVGALVDAVMGAETPVTVICIGPPVNLAAALAREPRIAHRTRVVWMGGSLRRGYMDGEGPVAEYNAARYPHATQALFAAPWAITITPLDTCGIVRLTGDTYRRVRDAADPLTRALIASYRAWPGLGGSVRYDPETETSVLFDTVAVYLAFSEALVEMERLGVRVTDDGHTLLDPDARPVDCAVGWKDLGVFQALLAARLARS